MRKLATAHRTPKRRNAPDGCVGSTVTGTGAARAVPAQTVLVLQGGGALGAYQLGVYEAMHEAGIEPDWVVGTSIGAINGAIIAGNPPPVRMEKLRAFWDRMEQGSAAGMFDALLPGLANFFTNTGTVTQGIPGFFEPNPAALHGQHARLGLDKASYYSTAPLRATLTELIDLDYLHSKATRLTVGAVNAVSGQMKYFDSRHEPLGIDHVMASGALPPAFPAVRINGEPYWDGGIYSNTPTEVVLDDNPRRDSVVFSVHLWNPAGPEPESLWEVSGRQKDIQFASRALSHVVKQQQIHKLRHIIRELVKHLPEKIAAQPDVRELASWGCGTTMHVLTLMAPRLEHEDQTKDIDFTGPGIHARWRAGYESARRAIVAAPWNCEVDARDGVLIHSIS